MGAGCSGRSHDQNPFGTPRPDAGRVAPLPLAREGMVESRFLASSGGKMHYVDEGRGPTVLMLHGNPTWLYFYRHQIENLRERYRCIALDYLGMGLSELSLVSPRGHANSLGTHLLRYVLRLSSSAAAVPPETRKDQISLTSNSVSSSVDSSIS